MVNFDWWSHGNIKLFFITTNKLAINKLEFLRIPGSLMCLIRSRHVLTVTCVPVIMVQEGKGAEIKDWVQQGSFVLLSGMLSIRQTRPTLLFRREATDFCGTSPAPVCLPMFQQGSVWVVGGRMVILSPQMDRKKPGGI